MIAFLYDNFVISSIKSIKVDRSSLWHLILCFWLHRAFSSCHKGGYSVEVQASLCGVSFCCRAQVLGAWAAVGAARRLSRCGLQAVEHGLSNSDARA